MSIGPAEEQLIGRGMSLEDWDLSDEPDTQDKTVDPDICGFAFIDPQLAGSYRVVLLVRPGLSSEKRELFAEWALQRVERFMEHGPEPDGWQRRKADGAWQLWTRLVELPDL